MPSSEIYEPSDDSFFLSDILKKEIPKLLNKDINLRFLEIGCGSGIQLQTALKSGIKKENIFSCDINPDAVEYCGKLEFNCTYSDLFSTFKGGVIVRGTLVPHKFDVIVFNPPYLPMDKREPKTSQLATTGGKKGGEIINRFLRQAKKHLIKDGRIILLVSSLTKGLDFDGYKKKILAEKKLFFEKLIGLELS